MLVIRLKFASRAAEPTDGGDGPSEGEQRGASSAEGISGEARLSVPSDADAATFSFAVAAALEAKTGIAVEAESLRLYVGKDDTGAAIDTSPAAGCTVASAGLRPGSWVFCTFPPPPPPPLTDAERVRLTKAAQQEMLQAASRCDHTDAFAALMTAAQHMAAMEDAEGAGSNGGAGGAAAPPAHPAVPEPAAERGWEGRSSVTGLVKLAPAEAARRRRVARMRRALVLNAWQSGETMLMMALRAQQGGAVEGRWPGVVAMCLRAAGEQNALEKAARAVDERRRAHLAELGFTSEAFAPPPPPPAPTAATGVGGYGAPDTDSTGSVDDSGSGGDSDGGGGYGDGFAAALPSDPVDAARDGPAAAAPGAASPSLSGTTYVCAAGPMGATALHLLVARKLRDPHSPVIAIAAALLAHGADANAKDHEGHTPLRRFLAANPRHRLGSKKLLNVHSALHVLLAAAERSGGRAAVTAFLEGDRREWLTKSPNWGLMGALPALVALDRSWRRVLIGEWAEQRVRRREAREARAGTAELALWGGLPRAALAHVMLQLSTVE